MSYGVTYDSGLPEDDPILTGNTIRPGTLVSYRLLPRHKPTNIHKVWHGEILKIKPEMRLCWVVSTEPGYEGLEECILLDQIVEVASQYD